MSRDRKLRNTITSRRLTLLPGFLSAAVRSESARIDPETARHVEPRRSQRLKSIFRQIEERYALASAPPCNADFGQRLLSRLGPHCRPLESAHYGRLVLQEVALVDEALRAPLAGAMALNRKRPFGADDDKENCPSMKFPYVPPTKWVFQTPPNRKLNYGHVRAERSCMRPAILESRNEGKVVYEVDRRINVDFSGFTSRQEIDIDKRYMVEVGSGEDVTFRVDDREEEEGLEKKFQFQTDPYELENHFLSLTCRPKKAPLTISRVASMKRKRDIFEPEQGCSSNQMETVTEFDSSFSFLNNLSNMEESFTFKFTANDGATTGHMFDFEGNQKDTFNFRC